jgi:porphobilinogen synthase
LRQLVQEGQLAPRQLIMPLFVRPGRRLRQPIPSMPGQHQLSIDALLKECEQLQRLGLGGVLLFGVATHKDAQASRAFASQGLVQQALRALKARLPRLLVLTDVCLCAYTSHGHCGLLHGRRRQNEAPRVDLPGTLRALARTAVSHAQAGADVVAPSDMMDGNVAAIRHALDAAGHTHVPILAYTAKYASALYGPFREAANSAPQFGDRRGYQMDPRNAEEALREAQADLAAGADMLMVKPALGYLDIIYRLKQAFAVPVAAFNVSGEYAMVKAAAARGWVDEPALWMEQLLCLRRAGADVLITYWAQQAAQVLQARTR